MKNHKDRERKKKGHTDMKLIFLMRNVNMGGNWPKFKCSLLVKQHTGNETN